MPYGTAGTIVDRTALQLGLGRSVNGDPFGYTDPNFQQLCELLAMAGEELSRSAIWPQLRKSYSITTVAGQTVYPLPSDFGSMIDQSGWRQGTVLPMTGPVSECNWEYLKARQPGPILNVVFRQGDGTLEIAGASPAGVTVSFEYKSNAWVVKAGSPSGSAGNATAPTASGDTVLFDQALCIRALKLQFQTAKGMDTTAALAEYQRALSQQIGAARGAPIFNLAGRRRFISDRLLDPLNVSDTGYGS